MDFELLVFKLSMKKNNDLTGLKYIKNVRIHKNISLIGHLCMLLGYQVIVLKVGK